MQTRGPTARQFFKQQAKCSAAFAEARSHMGVGRGIGGAADVVVEARIAGFGFKGCGVGVEVGQQLFDDRRGIGHACAKQR